MITLAKKLITCSGTTKKLEVNGYVEFVSSTPMTITPKYTNSGVTLRYSLDGITWTPIVSGVTTPSANIIYFIGRAAGTKSLYNSNTYTNAWTFSGSTNLECKGKLDRLLQDDLGGDSDILTIGNYCFCFMLYNITSLISVDDDCLPATTLATDCYRYMFQVCPGLTTAPALPATTLASNCYNSMFQECTSLTTAPTLPATILATGCYNGMFTNCTGLVTAPTLPAMTLQSSCYNGMFTNCTGLVTAPTLPATILATDCYQSMFYGCTSLTAAPTLPAMTLQSSCYNSMFTNCTGLVTAPTLPATILATDCYKYMFYNCTRLKLSTTLTGIYDTAYRIPTTGTGTTASNALGSMFSSTGGTFTGTPTINTTYYTENTPV